MKSFTLSLAVCAFLAAADALGVTIDWSPVGNPGNAADVTGFGSVGYAYNIGTYDVTSSQYVEFLNAKDPTGANTLGLYNSLMSTHGPTIYNAGNANGNKYSVFSAFGNHPVTWISWYDAIRFANWMNNGQGNGDTETGAYTFGPLRAGGVPINGDSITRNAGATIFLPSENEWYKAAYYDPRTTAQGGPPLDSHYWLYPTSSNMVPTASAPTTTPNSANYNLAAGNLTDVGAYMGTTSPYGSFDMAGNVVQWNDTLIKAQLGFTEPCILGSSIFYDSIMLPSSIPSGDFPTDMRYAVGFRLANIPTGFIPEPSGLVLAALGFFALAWRLRRR